jgi:glycine dehydrogenase subunit 1
MGKTGFTQLANLCFQKAHYAAGEISKLNGYELAFSGPFFKEFVVRCKRATAAKVVQAARKEGIFAGIDLGRWFPEFENCLLVAVTEKRTKGQIDKLVSMLDKVKD